MKRLYFILIFFLYLLVSEVVCFVKVLRCNWEPIGKAEAVYTIGLCTGTSMVIAWLDIEDK